MRKKPLLLRAHVLGSGPLAINAADIKVSSKVRSKLSPPLQYRARELFQHIGKRIHPDMTEERWVEQFTHDENPADEIAEWERIAEAFDIIKAHHIVLRTQRKYLQALLAISMGVVDVPAACNLSEARVEKLRQAYNSVT